VCIIGAGAATRSSLTSRPHLRGTLLHYKLIANRQTNTLVGALAIAEKVSLHRLALLETPYSPAVGRDTIGDGVRELIHKIG